MYSTAPTPSLEPGAVPLVNTHRHKNLISVDPDEHSSPQLAHTVVTYSMTLGIILPHTGWFWLWVADFSALCPILPGGSQTVLHGGRGDRCSHLSEGKMSLSNVMAKM